MIRPAALLGSVLVGLLLAACAAPEDSSSARLRRGTPSATEIEGGEAASGTAGSTSDGVGSTPGSATSPGGGSSTTPTTPPKVGDVKQGKATFYDADGSGNCSFPTANDLMVVAPHKERYYDGSAACGACLRVTGKKGSVVVRVVDSCPVDTPDNDCGDTGADLDLSAQAFAKIEDPNAGIANVTFQRVPCDVAGPMQFRFKDGSSQWWTAVQVRNHREAIAKVEYAKSGSWITMTREDDNFFVEASGVGPHPSGLPLRITSINGQVVEETLPIQDGKTLTGTQQFD